VVVLETVKVVISTEELGATELTPLGATELTPLGAIELGATELGTPGESLQ